jgi:hypothetical protein
MIPTRAVELALAYAHAGLFDAADRLLADAAPGYPLVHYYRGWIKLQAGDEAGADACFAQGAAASPIGCFPNEIECAPALTRGDDTRRPAMRVRPTTWATSSTHTASTTRRLRSGNRRRRSTRLSQPCIATWGWRL